MALALEQDLQERVGDAEQPHGAGDAAGAGQQSEGDLGQADLGALRPSSATRWWQARAIS